VGGFFPYKEIRAVESLWPEAVHLLTLEGSGIKRLADLSGRRAAFISRETMRLGLAVPLHPAAEAFYDRYDRDQTSSAP